MIVASIVIVNLFVVRLSVVIGNSMEPTLSNGNIFLTKITDEFERYDIVVFENEDMYLVKRVIGCPNETIQIKENMIYINGEPIKDVVNVDMKDYGVASEPILLKDNEYFVLGDNRNDSMDSRMFGPVNTDVILGEKISFSY